MPFHHHMYMHPGPQTPVLVLSPQDRQVPPTKWMVRKPRQASDDKVTVGGRRSQARVQLQRRLQVPLTAHRDFWPPPKSNQSRTCALSALPPTSSFPLHSAAPFEVFWSWAPQGLYSLKVSEELLGLSRGQTCWSLADGLFLPFLKEDSHCQVVWRLPLLMNEQDQ